MTLLTIFMVSAEQRPSISATLFLCGICQGRNFESAPPDHKTLVAVFSKMPPKMERNMWKNALWVSKVTQYFCEVSCLRRSGLGEYLLSNRLLMSELKLNPKLALKCTHFWTSCSKVPQRRVACFCVHDQFICGIFGHWSLLSSFPSPVCS